MCPDPSQLDDVSKKYQSALKTIRSLREEVKAARQQLVDGKEETTYEFGGGEAVMAPPKAASAMAAPPPSGAARAGPGETNDLPQPHYWQ